MTDLPVELIFRNHVNPLQEKYFAFPEAEIRRMVRAVPSPQEGRYAIVTSVGRGMRWTLWCARRARRCGRRNRVVLIPRRWDQVLRDVAQGDGGKQSPVSEESSYKP